MCLFAIVMIDPPLIVFGIDVFYSIIPSRKGFVTHAKAGRAST